MKSIAYDINEALELDAFKELDFRAINELSLPISLMMENAGLNLAHRIVSYADKDSKILIGVGNGNNGGGGLVAARRLCGWGYHVYLDLPFEITKELPTHQLERAIAYGAQTEVMDNPDIWVDAYLGFSQRLPLDTCLISRMERANRIDCIKIAYDLPTGISDNISDNIYFNADEVVTVAAPKKILYSLPDSVIISMVDLGIPNQYYLDLGIKQPPYDKNSILMLIRE